MSLLAAIIPMLADGNSFSFSITRVGDQVRIVTNPAFAKFQPDTTDAELQAIQAALVMPVVLTVPVDEAQPDAEVAALLTQAHALRKPNLDRLATFNAAQAEAASVAALAQQKKTEAASAAAAAKPAAAKKAGAKAGTKAGAKTTTKASSKAVATGASMSITALAGDAVEHDDDNGADGGQDAADAASTPAAEASAALDTAAGAQPQSLDLFAD